MLHKIRQFGFWLAWPLLWLVDQYMIRERRRRDLCLKSLNQRIYKSMHISNLIRFAETKEHFDVIRREREDYRKNYPDDELQEYWDRMITDRDMQLSSHA